MTANPSSPPPLTPVLAALQDLIQVVAQLRSPTGCPWDREQTPQSLIPYVLEEAYETVHALRSEDPAAIAEELGDLLLQVVLQAQIASEQGQFSLATVAAHITQKLIRRHPHVFGDRRVETAAEVHQQWEQIKAAEKGESDRPPLLSTTLQRYAQTLPPLLASEKISRKAAAAGFEWACLEDVWGKVHEELNELKQAVEHQSRAEQEAELGDLFFALIQIARWQHIDPMAALQGTNQRFIQRLARMERLSDRPLADCTIAELEALWQQAKAQLAQPTASDIGPVATPTLD
ncbi:nucleoside triphosphate pyrophosphohydrolase [Trichothermofontia sp.]